MSEPEHGSVGQLLRVLAMLSDDGCLSTLRFPSADVLSKDGRHHVSKKGGKILISESWDLSG